MIRQIPRFAPTAFAALLAFGAAPASAQTSDPSVDLMLQAVRAGLPAAAAPQLVQNADVCASRGGQMMATTSGAQVCIGGVAAPGAAAQLGTVSLPGVEAIRVESAAIPGQGHGVAQQPVAFTAVPPSVVVTSTQTAPIIQQQAAAPVAIPQPPVQDAFAPQFAAPAPAPQQFAAPAPQQFAAPAPQQFAAPAPVAAPLPAALPSTTTTTVTTTTQSFVSPTYSAPTASAGSEGFVTLNLQEDPAASAACRQQGGISAHALDGRFLCLTGQIYRDIQAPAQQVLPASIHSAQ
ncbi:hypothetical protein [Neomegalonema sp.]|uniref:hypothetical protein n=1 Tax=Neomegalonema sp. TaxID=2039713 RepID=UPI002631D632|nr:hypothetical protein [Neomegalonema sp.]MDD2867056.1 hypothetical protein [Neomegalonema sp.]